MHWEFGPPELRSASEPPAAWLEELELIRELLMDEEFQQLAARYAILRTDFQTTPRDAR
jgi:hypothetical protein